MELHEHLNILTYQLQISNHQVKGHVMIRNVKLKVKLNVNTRLVIYFSSFIYLSYIVSPFFYRHYHVPKLLSTCKNLTE